MGSCKFLVNLLNRLGIPNGSALLGIDRKFRVEVGTLEGLAYYLNNTDLPDVVYEPVTLIMWLNKWSWQ